MSHGTTHPAYNDEVIYEELKLRPSSGAIDHDAITAWLAAKDYAFLDPIGGEVWHLSATKQEMEVSRRERIAKPDRLPDGVFVRLLPDHVSVNAYWATFAEARALELIRWLVSEGEWFVQRDQSPFEPLGDPARLFPEGTGELDCTVGDLTEGVRYTWEAAGRSCIVHSSGQWRVADFRGQLSPSALAEWSAAVANAGELIEYVHPDTATATFGIEDESGLERAWLDATDVPTPLRPIAALVEKWVAGDSTWTVEDLELWMLAKMRGPIVEPALAQLGRSVDDMRRTAQALGAVLDKPGGAAEYWRILGLPRSMRPMTVSGTFAGSVRYAYVLPLWPYVMFVVHEHPDGYAWGYGFEGGPTSLPLDLASMEPWRWSAERLRREAIATEILEEWSFDLDVHLTFANGARFLARFDLGLLQSWEPA